MMGRLNHDQEQFSYSCRLEEAVPDDHPVRAIAGVLDLGLLRTGAPLTNSSDVPPRSRYAEPAHLLANGRVIDRFD